ncbi:MAG: hypothetical protein A2175_00015 [Candidatus Nealsonbacteria bacterium RBG_13_42_11]|uniref:Prepilin-type N-terminal cleavage/methylation domain-containing protein n=1 Tax=Candidatus Nealsonbacteria bacterium RBG_13_42_11 TaxID=1801663 RepID=A0A1G2E0I6_9BACT|nr:MAG: hypothetical protein A2175_00015 [Candidatus Nealsonbacteria bacterium RBG_13_42_11]
MLKNKSFTLLEVILAISVLTLAVGGSFGLLQQTLLAASLASSKLTATYLAQEGIEIVRNIRDNNWLLQEVDESGNVSWKAGLIVESNPVNYYEAIYDSPSLILLSGDTKNLYINNDGFYSYDENGTKTKFKRIITIEDNGDYLNVAVKVEWQERIGGIQNIEARELLYNWYGY